MKVEIGLSEGIVERVKLLQTIFKEKGKDMTIEEICVDLIDDCVDIWIKDAPHYGLP